MSKFKEIITYYYNQTNKPNDKRIMKEALDLLSIKEIVNDDETNTLKEIFLSLKEDETLFITQNPHNLNFMVAITKQNIPIIENKHDVNLLCNELIKHTDCVEMSKIEDATLTFLYACEHIEENEVLVIHEIIRLLKQNWSLGPIAEMDLEGQRVKYTEFIPNLQKRLIKN